MNLWQFLDTHPVWGFVYLATVVIGLQTIAAMLRPRGSGDRAPRERSTAAPPAEKGLDNRDGT